MSYVKQLKAVFSLWFTLMLMAGAGVCVAFYIYRDQFGGAYSSNAEDWAAFGSYMGGVLGPLISLLTLVVVIRTVYLQRELLDTQREETLALKVAAAQDTSVKAIEMLIAMQEKDYDRNLGLVFKYHEEYRDVLEGGPDVDDKDKQEKKNKIIALIDCRDRARDAVALLSKLALNISTGKFSGVEEVRGELKVKVEGVYKELDEKYPSTANKKVDQVAAE